MPVPETEKQITKHLNQYYAKEIQLLYDIVSQTILNNTDFTTALDEYDEENGFYDADALSEIRINDVIKEMTGTSPRFDYHDVLSEDEMALVCTFGQLQFEKRIKKARRIELISKAFVSDALFEGFCLAALGDDEHLRELCVHLGCPGRYEALSQDPVYLKRRAYRQKLAAYCKAAVNLYGCIDADDLLYLIMRYERSWGRPKKKASDYERRGGSYRRTLLFSPQWLNLYTLQEFCRYCVLDTLATADGLVIHGCFAEDYTQESEQWVEFLGRLDRIPEPQEVEAFTESIRKQMSYRLLLEKADEKPMYEPSSAKEFLSYQEKDAVSPALKNLERFLRRKYMDAFETYAAEQMPSEELPEGEVFTADDALGSFMYILSEQIVNGRDCLETDPMDVIHALFDLVNEYDIVVDSDQDAERLANFAMEISNSSRLWINHGYTPNEMMAAYRAKGPGRGLQNGGSGDAKQITTTWMPTIVPGSSRAAQMLSEGRDEIEEMGFTVDLDSNASEIPVVSMPAGSGGPMVRSTKKIYPNDPCPCGSGKKYKKCCGRKV